VDKVRWTNVIANVLRE